jgi:hypothetical protein
MLNVYTAHYVSLILVGVSVVAVFTYIPVISDFAFWFALAAYMLLWGYRQPAK